MICPKCGKEVDDNFKICPGCACILKREDPPAPPTSPAMPPNSGIVAPPNSGIIAPTDAPPPPNSGIVAFPGVNAITRIKAVFCLTHSVRKSRENLLSFFGILGLFFSLLIMVYMFSINLPAVLNIGFVILAFGYIVYLFVQNDNYQNTSFAESEDGRLFKIKYSPKISIFSILSPGSILGILGSHVVAGENEMRRQDLESTSFVGQLIDNNNDSRYKVEEITSVKDFKDNRKTFVVTLDNGKKIKILKKITSSDLLSILLKKKMGQNIDDQTVSSVRALSGGDELATLTGIVPPSDNIGQ